MTWAHLDHFHEGLYLTYASLGRRSDHVGGVELKDAHDLEDAFEPWKLGRSVVHCLRSVQALEPCLLMTSP